MGEDGDSKMGDVGDARDDESPLHNAANALPSVDDLAAARAALAAATADMPSAPGPNPYQAAAAAAAPIVASSPNKVRSAGRGSAVQENKGLVKKPAGRW